MEPTPQCTPGAHVRVPRILWRYAEVHGAYAEYEDRAHADQGAATYGGTVYPVYSGQPDLQGDMDNPTASLILRLWLSLTATGTALRDATGLDMELVGQAARIVLAGHLASELAGYDDDGQLPGLTALEPPATDLLETASWRRLEAGRGTFGDALLAMQSGHRVQRGAWLAEGKVVCLREGYPDGIPVNDSTATSLGITPGQVVRFAPYFLQVERTGTCRPWVGGSGGQDLLGEDWSMVDHVAALDDAAPLVYRGLVPGSTDRHVVVDGALWRLEGAPTSTGPLYTGRPLPIQSLPVEAFDQPTAANLPSIAEIAAHEGH